jgi:predicted ATPase/DNA-binding SARP family transcriptional activator
VTQYELYLFGPPRLEVNGEPIVITLRKAMAILVYLAVTRQPHRRDALATLFWPEKDQRSARANLRRTLYELTQQLEKHSGLPLIDADDETVALIRNALLWTDIATFQHYLAEPTPADSHAAVPPALLEAAALYTDDFMAGFTLSDAPTFDDWQFFQREELRQQLATVLATLVDAYEAQGLYEKAIHYARRWLHLDLLEETVHRRLMALYAQDGQTAAAVRQYDECARLLAEELDAPPAEETTALFEAIRTRRFPAPATVTQQLPAAVPEQQVDQTRPVHVEPPAIPPAQPVADLSPRHNLPTHTTPFIGRKREIAEIVRRLSDPTCHLLTLIGPGGIGKTRLAIEVARRLATPHAAVATASPVDGLLAPDLFPDGIFLVELQSVQSLNGVIAAIAEAIGFRFYSAVPPQEQLMHYLRAKQLLLLLDNVEQLLAETDLMALLVAELLAAAPGIKLLVTSREALNLQEEWFHPLGGMHFSRNQRDALADEAAADNSAAVADAVQLFVQNARRARADFDLAGEQEAVLRICRLVDGVPLALELAAAWIKVLPCPQIADEIEQNLDILTTRHQNIPSRHRSMRAVLEQSWQLLTAAEQAILYRLALFQRGFTQEAAQTVAGASLLTLAMLTEKALVRVSQEGSTHNRYQMHELLRQFAAEKFAEAEENHAAAQASHATYYLQILAQQAVALLDQRQQHAVTVIADDLENMQVALLWTLRNGDWALLPSAIDALYNFYQIQSRYLEGKELFVTASQRWRDEPAPADQIGQRLHLQLLARTGALCYLLCEYGAAERYLQEALTLADALAEARECAFTLNFLGRLAVWQGEKEQARQLLTRSLTISQTLGDINRTASALEKLASLLYATFGDYSESKTLVLESLTLSRQLGRPDRIAYALDTLGFVTFCLGEYAEAEVYYQESVEIFERSGDHYGRAMALGGLALIYWALGGEALPKATAYFQQSLEICRRIGHHGQVSGRLVGLARVANDQGNYREAERLAREALTIARDLGIPIYLSHILYCLGEAAYQLGDLTAARAHIIEALQLTADTGLQANLATILYHYAMLLGQETAQQQNRAAAAQRQRNAWLIFTQVCAHPATWHTYKTRAGQQASALADLLSTASVPASTLATDEQTLEALAHDILHGRL